MYKNSIVDMNPENLWELLVKVQNNQGPMRVFEIFSGYCKEASEAQKRRIMEVFVFGKDKKMVGQMLGCG